MRRNWSQELTDPIYWLRRFVRVGYTGLQGVILGSLNHLLFFRYPQFDLSSIQKILLIRLDRIGDMVLTTPILEALKVGFPQVDLVVLANNYNASVIAMPELGLRGVMAALNRCNLLLCNNSGPLHVASALGVPTVSTMGPTIPHLWWPIGGIHTVLRKDLPCSPCQRGRCKWHDCMKLITVDEITGAAKAQIEKRMN